MNDALKSFVNLLSQPTIYFTLVLVGWWALMKFHRQWTNPKYMKIALWLSFVVFAWALTDQQFRSEALKPDNLPIWLMTYGVAFFTWFAFYRASLNDQLMEKGLPNLEKVDSDKKVYTWPDLVYSELVCMVLFTAFLIIWGILIKAPLEQPANTGITPPVAKAPWYFLGLQEMLVYFDPWIAGVVLPGLIVSGLIVMPYIDTNPKGNGYYTIKERFGAIWLFGFGFVPLWIALIFLGTFMRGPGWNFFGPFEVWDTHKVEALVNVNLSELVWVKLLNTGLPESILLREGAGIFLVVVYLFVLPPVLAATVFKKWYEDLGFLRYNIIMIHVIIMASLPAKMYLRWLFNLKYLVAIPEYQFNI
jgi:hypothetical protein